MNKGEALYFLEGLLCGMSAPDETLCKKLLLLIAGEYAVLGEDLERIRDEIDGYLDVVEGRWS